VGFFVRPEALDGYAKLVERNGINLSLTNVHLAGESRLVTPEEEFVTMHAMKGLEFRSVAVVGLSKDAI
jgi:superfamily I DNA/RNA helicase